MNQLNQYLKWFGAALIAFALCLAVVYTIPLWFVSQTDAYNQHYNAFFRAVDAMRWLFSIAFEALLIFSGVLLVAFIKRLERREIFAVA